MMSVVTWSVGEFNLNFFQLQVSYIAAENPGNVPGPSPHYT